jgi:malate/lactate dehydrogenase
MTKVIIGSGNVAQHLITAFQNAENLGTEIELVQVYSRRLGTVSHLLDHAKITDDLNSLLEADLYIIAVSDAVIAEIAAQLPFKNRLVVHTRERFLNAWMITIERFFIPCKPFQKRK